MTHASAASVHLLPVPADRLEALRTLLASAGFLDDQRLSATAFEPPTAAVQVGALIVDRARHEVVVLEPDGERRCLPFTPTELALLSRLAARAGHVLSRRQLLEHVHGAAEFRGTRTIDSHIRNLRRKLRGTSAPTIVTVPGVGYKLADDRAPAARSGMSAGMPPSSAPHSASAR
jgi:DNA-binding response OmpR family regulator